MSSVYITARFLASEYLTAVFFTAVCSTTVYFASVYVTIVYFTDPEYYRHKSARKHKFKLFNESIK